MLSKVKLLLPIVFIATVLTGCSPLSTFLGRTDVSGATPLAPLDGILQSVINQTGQDNIVWATPDTNETIDIVFKEGEQPFVGQAIDTRSVQQALASLTPNNDNPSYRYFKYAEGVPIPAYKLVEGVNITVDKKYLGNDSLTKTIQGTNSHSDDTATPTDLMPVFGRVLDPNLNRWSSDPELYTLRKDYTVKNSEDEQEDIDNGSYLGPYDPLHPEQVLLDSSTATSDANPPAAIFVLYEPGTYWQTDNPATRDHGTELMYFDVYYSMDQWNSFIDRATGEFKAKQDQTPNLIPPNTFGICKYNSTNNTGTQTLSSTPALSGDDNGSNPLPTLHTPCTLFGPGHCCDAALTERDCINETVLGTNPIPNGDLRFTLVTMLTNPTYSTLAQADATNDNWNYSQPNVNLWVKYEFIDMLNSGNATFNIINDKLKPLLEKSQFSAKSNLQVPIWLYSEQAVNTNLAGACAGNAQCVLAHSRYRVNYIPLLSWDSQNNDKPVFYHNRNLVYDNKLYELASSSTGTSGARAASTADQPDWPWCWFTPE